MHLLCTVVKVFHVLQDTCHKLFCVFGDYYASGTQDAEVTKALIVEDFKGSMAKHLVRHLEKSVEAVMI